MRLRLSKVHIGPGSELDRNSATLDQASLIRKGECLSWPEQCRTGPSEGQQKKCHTGAENTTRDQARDTSDRTDTTPDQRSPASDRASETSDRTDATLDRKSATSDLTPPSAPSLSVFLLPLLPGLPRSLCRFSSVFKERGAVVCWRTRHVPSVVCGSGRGGSLTEGEKGGGGGRTVSEERRRPCGWAREVRDQTNKDVPSWYRQTWHNHSLLRWLRLCLVSCSCRGPCLTERHLFVVFGLLSPSCSFWSSHCLGWTYIKASWPFG